MVGHSSQICRPDPPGGSLTPLRGSATERPDVSIGYHLAAFEAWTSLWGALTSMLELKTRPPPARSGVAERKLLVDRLLESESPVITVVAPAGYGKSTLMGQLHRSLDRAAAWLTLDIEDNDPAALLMGVAGALAKAGMIEKNALESGAFRSDDVLTRGVNELLESVVPRRDSWLFIDQVDVLTNQTALDVVGALMSKAADSLRMVVAARSQQGLPIPLLRSRGSISEISSAELALSAAEAREIFDSMGIGNVERIEDVIVLTEGWPAGVYLAGLAAKNAGVAASPIDVRGDDVYLADYFRQEFYEHLPEDLQRFLTHSSVLPRLSGPLCDFVLERDHSAQTLSDLGDSNLLIVPMDHHRRWFRYHSLLKEFLLSELRLQEPSLEQILHSRAATWFEEEGFNELAVESARLAEENERFATMVGRYARPAYAEGHIDTLTGWLDALEEANTIERYPELAAMGGFVRALEGDVGGAMRLSFHAFDSPDGSPRNDEDLGPIALMYRSFVAERGVEPALTDAKSARTAFGHAPQWIHVATAAEALAMLATEGLIASEGLWTEMLWYSDSIGAHPSTSLALAVLALRSLSDGDWEAAAQHIDTAITEIRSGRTETYVTSGLAFSLLARIDARRGDISAARISMGAATAVRPKLAITIPVLSVLTLHEMALSQIELADIAGARRVMRDAADILALRPRLGLLVAEHDEIRARLASLPVGSIGPTSLTTAELRLLPFLTTHLTYPEIAERLFLSRHTVKTQAMSIYRKLGVSSRNDAVQAAREAGMLGG